jgi:hypothetical protein
MIRLHIAQLRLQGIDPADAAIARDSFERELRRLLGSARIGQPSVRPRVTAAPAGDPRAAGRAAAWALIAELSA